MLRKVSTGDLKEDMRFTAPVFFDDGMHMLADVGVPLHRRELDALARWNIPYVLTSGAVLKESELPLDPEDAEEAEELGSSEPTGAYEADIPKGSAPQGIPKGKFEKTAWNDMDGVSGAKPPIASRTHKTLAEAFPDGKVERIPASMRSTPQYALYKSFVATIDGLFASIKKSDTVSRAVDGVAGELRLFILESRASAVRCIFGNDIPDREMAKNAVHAAIIAMLVAENLSISDAALERIITGALLHDVGMLRVPDKIISKSEKLSGNELAIIHHHPIFGYKIIHEDLMYPEDVAIAAMQHHEHWDGSGYPSGLAGREISLQARIISAADAFVAMVSARAYRSRFSGYEAMKNLVADNARRYDPDIVRAMIQNIGIYPVGSIVLLNNAAIARVTQVFPGSPLRPVVKVIMDESGRSYPDDESEAVDLRANKGLFIVRDINPAEI